MKLGKTVIAQNVELPAGMNGKMQNVLSVVRSVSIRNMRVDPVRLADMPASTASSKDSVSIAMKHVCMTGTMENAEYAVSNAAMSIMTRTRSSALNAVLRCHTNTSVEGVSAE